MSWIRHIFTANDAPVLTSLLNAEFDAAKANAGDGSSDAVAAFLGNGRLISAPLAADDGDSYLPPSPALAVTLPAGTRWVQNGALIILENDVLISGVPANFTGWVAPLVDAADESWSLSTYAARPALGSGVLGRVTSDADSVTAIDTSEVQSDVVLTMPLLLARLRPNNGGNASGTFYDDTALRGQLDNHETRITTLEGAQTGDGIAPPDATTRLVTTHIREASFHALQNPRFGKATDAAIQTSGTGMGQVYPNGEVAPDVRGGSVGAEINEDGTAG